MADEILRGLAQAVRELGLRASEAGLFHVQLSGPIGEEHIHVPSAAWRVVAEMMLLADQPDVQYDAVPLQKAWDLVTDALLESTGPTRTVSRDTLVRVAQLLSAALGQGALTI